MPVVNLLAMALLSTAPAGFLWIQMCLWPLRMYRKYGLATKRCRDTQTILAQGLKTIVGAAFGPQYPNPGVIVAAVYESITLLQGWAIEFRVSA